MTEDTFVVGDLVRIADHVVEDRLLKVWSGGKVTDPDTIYKITALWEVEDEPGEWQVELDPPFLSKSWRRRSGLNICHIKHLTPLERLGAAAG